VLVYLTSDVGNLLARAPIASMDDADAYTYWDGEGWSAEPASAEPLWPLEESVLPVDNGLSVTFDDRTNKWQALYNAGLSNIEVRVADQPWGPWSEPVPWFECKPLVGDTYPYCYTATLHRELSRDDGATLYLTTSNPEPYDVSLVEVRLAVPVHGWIGPNAAVRYGPSAPNASYRDAGVAFYAADVALPGLAPVYEVANADGTYHYQTSPADAGATAAFFAWDAPAEGPISTVPVYRWTRDGAELLGLSGADGWIAGEVAFYVPATSIAADTVDPPALP
jgi:hypothetical protein